MRPLLAIVLLSLALTPARTAADPSERERYLLHCSGCHGSDGRGTPGVTPSLQGLAEIARLEGGRAYLARVPGVAQAPVDDDSLAALLNWVIAEFSREPPIPPYSADEIASLRRHPLRDPAVARSSLFRAARADVPGR